MNSSERRGGIPGAGSEEPPEQYSRRARLAFVIGGIVVLGFPIWLVYYESRSTPAGPWWELAGLWWTFVAACALTVALGRILHRTSKHS